MQNVFVTAVEGKYAIDEFGRKLVITGNAPVYAGSRVYTDGNIIYGWVINSEPIKYVPKSSYLPVYGYQFNWYLGFMEGVTIPAFSERMAGVTFPDEIRDEPPYVIPCWKGRPSFCNDGKMFYSFRGSWLLPKVYASGMENPYRPDGERLYIRNDVNGVWFWQRGNECWQKSHMESITYPRVNFVDIVYDPDIGDYVYIYDKETVTFDADDYLKSGVEYSAYGYPTYSLDGADHTDLELCYGSLEHDDDTISLHPIVTDILDTVRAMIKVYQETKPQGASPTAVPYYGEPPDPILCEFSLKRPMNGIHWSSEEIVNPPCDTNSSYGGSPLHVPDWYNIPEFTDSDDQAYNVIHAGYNSNESGDYRVILHPVKDGDVVQFKLIVFAEFQWFPYREELNNNYHYRPAITSNGAYWWDTQYIDYQGEWLISVDTGVVTKTEISRDFTPQVNWHDVIPSAIRNQYTERADNGLIVQNTPEVNTPYWRRVVKKGTLTFPKEFRNIRAVIPYGKNVVLVVGDLCDDDPDSGFLNIFIYAVGSTSVRLKGAGLYGLYGYGMREFTDSYVPIKSYGKLKKMFKALENIPFVE